VREYSHIKPDDIAAPIDIRLLPATILTITVCLLLPQLPDSWGTYLPWALPLLGGTIIVALWFVRSARKRRIFNFLLLIASACWLATPAAFVVQHQQIAAQKSGWLEFTEEAGTARISGHLVTSPVERSSRFGPSWFATVEVEHFGRDLVATNHPAKIVVAADETWSDFSSDDQVCFMGRVTETDTTVFVTALAAAKPHSCGESEPLHGNTGRDLIRTALRDQSAQTIGYAPELLPGLILGDRSQQSDEIDSAMKVAGLSHLSAVSGAHTSLVASAATLLFRSLRLPRPLVIAAFLSTLLLFVQVVGMQPSILRAAIMGAIGAWALFFGRGAQALPLLSLSTMVNLSIWPELIHEVGFQLSVAATAGIVLAAQPLEGWLHKHLARFLPDILARFLSASLSISATAQLACQPILLTFIDYVSTYSLVANLVATPLLPFITVPGTLAAGLTVVTPSISQIIFHVVAVPATAVGWIATTLVSLPAAKLPWPEGIASTGLIILHWGASAIILLRLLRRQREAKPPVKVFNSAPIRQWLLPTLDRRLSLSHVTQSVIVVIAVVAHVAVFWPTKSTAIDEQWDVIGCDVGQGDMFLVRTGVDSAMVIDAGPDAALAQRCLAQAKIASIDVLVVTHLHADHYGGAEAIINTMRPDQIIYSTGTDPSYDPDIAGLPGQAQQANASKVQIIDHAALDENHPVQLRWTIVAANIQSASENNASIVLYIEIYRHGRIIEALFTGDLEEDEAARLLEQNRLPTDVDILKVGHHGAQNGGTEILEHTSPKIALIGVGENNTYGHPHEDILTTLGANTPTLRTDDDGTFSVTFEQKNSHDLLSR